MPGMSRAVGPCGGSGPVARVVPVVLAHLQPGAEASLVEAVRALAGLAHEPTQVGDAAALWALAVRHAILTGETGVAQLRAQLVHIPEERRHMWASRLDEAGQHVLAPSMAEVRSDNGQAHVAVQQALIAVGRGFDVRSVLQIVMQGGKAKAAADPTNSTAGIAARNDPAAAPSSDSAAGVAAIAGQLAGAVYGAATIPKDLTEKLHGFPNDMRADDLRRLVEDTLLRYDAWYG